MRRKSGIALALASALVAGNVAVAASRGDGHGTARHHVQTIRLTATTFADKDFDVDRAGLSLGDYFVATEDLSRSGEKVGHDHATCTITRLTPKVGNPKTATVQCVVTLMLPEGQITVQGARTAALDAQEPPRFTLAVTGGTGAYETARGTVHVADLDETDSQLTLRLIS